MDKLILFLACMMACGTCFAENNEAQKNDNAQKSKTLVLYYSQTGVTKTVAEELQKKLGADIESIKAVKPYDGDFNATIARCQQEMKNNELPEIQPVKHNLNDYDTIFLGFSVWFGTYARPIITLVKDNKFEGKKIIPFCTFGSGGLVECTEQLKKDLPNATILNGYGVREARIARTAEELDRFLKENKFIEGTVEALEPYSEQKPVTEEEVKTFKAACDGYQFPLGTPITVGSRKTANGVDYLYTVNGKTPNGKDVKSTIYVTVENGKTPEFTLVVR